jgi:hypothetical protein
MGETRGASQPYEEGTATNPRLKALILAAGYSRERAREMIGSALVEEIWGMLHENKPFDRGRFAGLLEKLG